MIENDEISISYSIQHPTHLIVLNIIGYGFWSKPLMLLLQVPPVEAVVEPLADVVSWHSTRMGADLKNNNGVQEPE